MAKIHLLGVRGERRQRGFVVIGKQDLHPLLGLLQLLLPLARELYAALKLAKGLFQRQVAVFEAGDDFFKFGQGALETGWRFIFFWHSECLAHVVSRPAYGSGVGP